MEDMTFRATTILCVRKGSKVAIAGDGQVTVGNTVMKHGAAKVRRLYHDRILAGFAGSAADAFALFSRFEAKLEEYRGNMERAVVELAKDWRLDKYLRQLQAFLIVANAERSYLISGTGDLIQPDDGSTGHRIGRALRAGRGARAHEHTEMRAAEIAGESLRIAASNLHLHERQHHSGDSPDRPAGPKQTWSSSFPGNIDKTPPPNPSALTPQQIVPELDTYIVGQHAAKRAVAIALRNRWRRQQLPAELREEIAPKNIIMIGPTGVGKTEIARRLARLAHSPFLKVEASKFTEVGYVGRDVESIVRDLTELGVKLVREEKTAAVSSRPKPIPANGSSTCSFPISGAPRLGPRSSAARSRSRNGLRRRGRSWDGGSMKGVSRSARSRWK